LRANRLATISAVAVVLAIVGTATVWAQMRGGGFGGGVRNFAPIVPNPPHDGRFAFLSLPYGPPTNFAPPHIPWSHDHPTGEQHFMTILNELTYLNPRTEETSILSLDDPELFRYPVAYLCEPGGWSMTDHEASTFRAYLQKGGFLIVDDFRVFHWGNFEE